MRERKASSTGVHYAGGWASESSESQVGGCSVVRGQDAGKVYRRNHGSALVDLRLRKLGEDGINSSQIIMEHGGKTLTMTLTLGFGEVLKSLST